MKQTHRQLSWKTKTFSLPFFFIFWCKLYNRFWKFVYLDLISYIDNLRVCNGQEFLQVILCSFSVRWTVNFCPAEALILSLTWRNFIEKVLGPLGNVCITPFYHQQNLISPTTFWVTCFLYWFSEIVPRNFLWPWQGCLLCDLFSFVLSGNQCTWLSMYQI